MKKVQKNTLKNLKISGQVRKKPVFGHFSASPVKVPKWLWQGVLEFMHLTVSLKNQKGVKTVFNFEISSLDPLRMGVLWKKCHFLIFLSTRKMSIDRAVISAKNCSVLLPITKNSHFLKKIFSKKLLPLTELENRKNRKKSKISKRSIFVILKSEG